MIAVKNGSEGLDYGKRSTFSTGFDMDHLIYQRKGGLNELSEAMCTVFQVDKNHSFHYVVHYTSKHFSLATGELISENIQRKSIAPLKQPFSR